MTLPATSETANDVERAWVLLLGCVDVDWRAKTPRELAGDAIDRGLDPDAVYALTAAFEEVQYGNGGPTDEQCRRARRAMQRLDAAIERADATVPANPDSERWSG